VCASGGRGRGKESQADSLLSAAPDVGHNPTTHEIMTWTETKRVGHPTD